MGAVRKVARWVGRIPEHWFLIGIYVLALLPRMAFVLGAGRANPGVDEFEYHTIAMNLVAGKGYTIFGVPTAFRPPGYPFLLAGIYYVVGPNFFLARIIQAFITAATPLLTYLVCRTIYDVRAARWSAVFVAFYVPFILYAVGLMTENVSIPLLLLVVWLLLKVDETRSILYALVCGAAMSAVILLRPELTYFLPFVLLWLWLPTQDWKKAFVPFAIICGIVTLVVTPWCIRNYREAGQFVYLDTRAGFNMYIGYHEGADGTFNMRAAMELQNLLRKDLKEGRTPNDVEMHNWGKQRALQFMREHPWRSIGLLPLKFAYFWNLEHHLFVVAYSFGYLGPLPSWLIVTMLVPLVAPFAILVLLSIVGVVLGGRWSKGVWLLLLLIGFYTALHTAMFGESRLHFPLVPYLAIFAAAGIEVLRGIRERWGSAETVTRASTRRRGFVALAVCALFVAVWSFGIWHSMPEFTKVLAPGGHRAQLDY